MTASSIVDSHVHLWNPDRFRYPWLDALPALNRAFLPADFAAASVNSNVSKIIFVECGCEPAQSLAEVDWVSGPACVGPRLNANPETGPGRARVSRASPGVAPELSSHTIPVLDRTKNFVGRRFRRDAENHMPEACAPQSQSQLRGIVAHAPLEKGGAARVELNALASRQLVKGVRRNLQGERDPEFCLQPEFVAGVKLLVEFAFTFDLCVRHEQLHNVVELARRVPQVTFVLDHCGKPDVRGGRVEPWATDLQALAALPNVVCKISGLATEADPNHWRPADLKDYFQRALECFGFDRLLFGGDWPVATLATSYERWLETVKGFFSFATETDRAKLFQTNAERIYRV
jgi:L-fuconolactonase